MSTQMNLQGVKCPVNFIKIRLELEKMKAGEILEVIIDDGEPIDSVPRSLQLEGFEVCRQEPFGENGWLVCVKK